MQPSAAAKELQFSRPDSLSACLSEPWTASRQAQPRQRSGRKPASGLPRPRLKGSKDMTVAKQPIQQCGIGVGSLTPLERGVARSYDPVNKQKFHRGWATNNIRPTIRVYSKALRVFFGRVDA